MTNLKSTKRALLSSVVALILCFSMLLGTTFAWFTDSASSGMNQIVSGNLDVELYYTYDAAVAADVDSNAWIAVTDQTDVFGYNLWEPGYVKIAYFKVVNNGTLALKYHLDADVYSEQPGKNQAGADFLLSDYLKTALINVGASRDDILAMSGSALKSSFAISQSKLATNESAVVGMAIWMPTTVGNEANHNGVNVPAITFGINLIATQDTVENDSFGKDYDEDSVYPVINLPAIITAGVAVDDTTTFYDIPLRTPSLNDDGEYSKQGSVEVPKEAVADDADNIEVVIKKMPIANSAVSVGQDEQAATIDISVSGIKEGNTTPITVKVNIGAGLGTIKLYHNNEQIDYISYNNSTGMLAFQTTSFSPFTVVYDGKEPVYDDNVTPNADVTDITADYAGYDWAAAWETGKLLSSIGDQKLDAVFKFKAPHDSSNVQECAYKDWECDYYVMLKSNTLTTLPEAYIALGGFYGDWGWNGFFNPEVETNVEIPLLGSVTSSAWTYADVVGFVSEFLCGVGVNTTEAGDALNGSEFIVMLRLTNPETREYVNVATVTYDFTTGNCTVVESTTLNPAN